MGGGTFQPFLRFWLGRHAAVEVNSGDMFQPFLRFWQKDTHMVTKCRYCGSVSTLLEILDPTEITKRRQQSLLDVSTLLEILGLVCLVVVGF